MEIISVLAVCVVVVIFIVIALSGAGRDHDALKDVIEW